MIGYQSEEYARAFEEFGEPVQLHESGTWILVRQIPGTEHYDAMGLYPVMCCEDWGAIEQDIAQVDAPYNLVSFTFIQEPFYYLAWRGYRADVYSLYKEHRIIDLRCDLVISDHHDYYAHRALDKVDVAVIPDPVVYLDQWCELYAGLTSRHNITGIQAFSRESFEWQLRVPGLVMFRASQGDETLGLHLWMQHEDVAYSHLAVSSEAGYDLSVAYALHWYAIDWFRDRVWALDIGAGAGVDGESDGLAWFKDGWTDSTLPVYLCGMILRPSAYEELSDGRAGFFPAYRAKNE